MAALEQTVPFMITHVDLGAKQSEVHRFEFERPDDLAEGYEVTCPSCQQEIQVSVKSYEQIKRERSQQQWQVVAVLVILFVTATAAGLPIWIIAIGVSLAAMAAIFYIKATRNNIGITVDGSDEQHFVQKAE